MSNPFEDAAAELDGQQSQPQQSAQVASSATGNPFADAAAELDGQTLQAQTPQLDSVENYQKQQSGGTSDNPFKAVIEFTQMLGEAHEVGQSGFRESSLGHAVWDGRLTLEEATKQIEADDHLAQMSGDLKRYTEDSAIPWLTDIALSTAKSLPMIEASLAVGAAGFGTGAGGTVALTAGAGTPLAVPVGSMLGTAATAGWTADYLKGQEYLKRRQQGYDHETAAAASTVSGLVQGALSGLKFGQAAKVPVQQAGNILKAHATSIAKGLFEGVRFGAEQIALSEAGTATRLITDAIAGTVAKVPNAVPTLEQAVQEFSDTFQETLKTSLGLFAGGKLAGTATGLTLKGVLKKTHDAHLKKQQAKLEQIKATEEAKAQADGTQPAQDSGNQAKPAEPSQAALERKARAEARLDKRIAAEREIRRIFEAAASRFRIESDETRLQEVNRIQRLLKRMVKNSDTLDDATKVKLLARVVEIDGEAALLKAGETFIEEQQTKEYKNALAEAKTKLQGAIKSGQLKGKRAYLPQETQASLTWYKEFFTEPKPEKAKPGEKRQAGEAQELSREAAYKKAADYVAKGMEEEAKLLNEQVDKLETGELAEIFNQPESLLEKRRIAMQAMHYWSGKMDQAGIVDLAGEVQQLVDGGKSTFLERKKAEGQRLLAARAEVLNAVQGIKPVKPSTDPNPPKQMTGFGKLAHSVRRTSTSLWDKLLQDTPTDERQKLIGKVLDFTEVENKEAAINLRAAEKLTNLYADAVGGIKEATKLIRDGADQKKRIELKFTSADGGTVTEHYTLNELTYLHIAFEDPGARPGLLSGNKYTLKGEVEAGHTSTQEAVHQILANTADGKYLKLGEAVQDFYRWYAPLIANHYLDEYGVPLPMDDNYSGQIFHRQIERQKNAADILNDVHQAAQRSLDPGSTKARNNSKLPVKLVDPFQQVQRHRADMAFWMANSPKARELSFIFSDSSKDGLRDVIAHKLGADFNGLVDSRLAFAFHLKPGIRDIGDGPFQTIKSNMATGMLGARIDQAPKQWTAILAPLHTCTKAEYIDGLRGAMDKERLNGYLSRSELYKDRQSHILPQILEATKERGYVDGVTGDKALALKTFFLTPMHKWGDGVGAAVSGFIEYNRVLKAGGTVEEAVLAGDRLVDATQSSSRPSQKVPAEMKGGVANLSLAFQKEAIQAMNRESGAIRDWFIHKDDKHLKRMARTIVSIHVAQTLFQAINNAPAFIVGDEKEQQEAGLRVASAFLAGSYGQMPLVGFDVVHGVLSGWKGEQDPRTVVGGLASDSAKLVKRLYQITEKVASQEDVEADDWIKAFKSIASVGSVATGLPFWGIFKYAELGGKVVKKAAGEE